MAVAKTLKYSLDRNQCCILTFFIQWQQYHTTHLQHMDTLDKNTIHITATEICPRSLVQKLRLIKQSYSKTHASLRYCTEACICCDHCDNSSVTLVILLRQGKSQCYNISKSNLVTSLTANPN